ncbi:hypothetical protein DPMN_108046 [Dreissena polymorpha]|uniref:MD-2-related lipid-recognition domain-containing protein n=2 Tax=Dreissena polymorpha TaxID=45954 RepID=A0A9D4K806_DREPO|nr:hypothetical protein DPMN_108046 [Dreissena polymorpha]
MDGCVFSVIVSALTIAFFSSIRTERAGATPYGAYSVHDDAFSWSLCNTTEVPIVMEMLIIKPNPYQYGQKINVSLVVNVTEDIPNIYPIEIDIKVMLRMGPEYYDICIFKESLCHVTDLCELVHRESGFKCPNSFQKNIYNFNGSIPVKHSNPAPTGRFNVTANISTNKRQLVCLNVQFCISHCDD